MDVAVKIAIINAYVLNNGDAALSFALYERLRIEGYEVVISTMNYKNACKIYPQMPFVKAPYEYTALEHFCMHVRNKLKLPINFEKIFIKWHLLLEKRLQHLDGVISVGGGYINSYYGVETKLFTAEALRSQNRCPLFMYSQSVGPLLRKDKIDLERYIGQYQLFMVRDRVSYERCKKYPNVVMTNDSAFLLKPISGKANKKIVAVSVRSWNADGRNLDWYFQLIEILIRKCMEQGYKIEFISTCQGEGYSDHLVAQEIKKRFSVEEQKHIQIDKNTYTLNDLREKLRDYDFIIGTRLHMCILGMLSGTPAFNISYEEKGKECFRYLEMEQYSIDYNEEIEQAEKLITEFIRNIENVREQLPSKMKKAHEEALAYFSVWKIKMEECCEQN